MDGLKRLSIGVVGLVALVLLSGCSQDRLVNENTQLKTQNRELQTALNDERSAKEALENERNNLAGELSRMQSQPASDVGAGMGFGGIAGVETDMQGGNIHVRIPGDILFASGKVSLKTSAEKTLNQIAGVINRDYANKTIRIEGFTDSDPIHKSKWKDNLELSLQRAAAVHRYLQGKGIDANRMYAAGFGESKQRGNKAQSRRVEIVVVARD